MIIFGTRGITSTLKEGTFSCPQCESNQAYRHRQVRKFFTLYFIPLIPLDTAGDYVECQRCKGTFVSRVLRQGNENEKFMALYETAMRHTMIKMMLADGVIEEEEKAIVLQIINKFGKNDLTMEQLDNLIKDIQRDNRAVDHYLKQIASSLNEHGKETIIKCAIQVACADNNFDDSEKELIMDMSKALEMSPSHLKGIFTEMFDPKVLN